MKKVPFKLTTNKMNENRRNLTLYESYLILYLKNDSSFKDILKSGPYLLIKDYYITTFVELQ